MALMAGLHTYYNGWHRTQRARESKRIVENHPQFDCSLQLDCMKSESLVIADQNAAVNTFPGLVHTARHTMGVDCTRSG